jgi:hypothetical protein
VEQFCLISIQAAGSPSFSSSHAVLKDCEAVYSFLLGGNSLISPNLTGAALQAVFHEMAFVGIYDFKGYLIEAV